MPSYQTGFTVDHGFGFVNRFTFDLWATPLLHLGRISPGLCGGMAYAALDYFHAGVPIPAVNEPPAQQTPLCRYLIQRQMDSNSLGLVFEVARWSVRDQAALEARMLSHELPALRARLQAGEPAVLVLIRAHSLGEITHNHQVVAYGYSEDAATGAMIIPIYDPNWPGQAVRLSLELAQPDWGLEPWHSRDLGFKGFILQEYEARRQGLPELD